MTFTLFCCCVGSTAALTTKLVGLNQLISLLIFDDFVETQRQTITLGLQPPFRPFSQPIRRDPTLLLMMISCRRLPCHSCSLCPASSSWCLFYQLSRWKASARIEKIYIVGHLSGSVQGSSLIYNTFNKHQVICILTDAYV